MPFARKKDPKTSHDAADAVTHIAQTQKRILQLLEDYDQMSDVGILECYRFFVETKGWNLVSESGLRTRRKELVFLGMVEDSGFRVKLDTGRTAISWQITATGLKALHAK